MQTLSLVSQKGGAGKTTLAINLAAAASLRGQKTMLIDLDPQGSAARWADLRGEREPHVTAESPARVGRVVDELRRQGYDFIVIDTPPNADQHAKQAALCADLVAIPCRLSFLDLDAIGATIDLCELVKRPARVVFNAVPPTAMRSIEEASQAMRARNAIPCPILIRERAVLRHAITDGLAAQEYEPDCRAAQEISELLDLLQSNIRDCQLSNGTEH